MKEEKDAVKEAFNARPFAEFLFGPGGRQAGAVLLPFGVPGDEAQPPIASIQANDARMEVIQTYGPLQERACERGIMNVGWGKQKEERQAGATTEQGYRRDSPARADADAERAHDRQRHRGRLAAKRGWEHY